TIFNIDRPSDQRLFSTSDRRLCCFTSGSRDSHAYNRFLASAVMTVRPSLEKVTQVTCSPRCPSKLNNCLGFKSCDGAANQTATVPVADPVTMIFSVGDAATRE